MTLAFSHWYAFWRMGGYAGYVWSAYIIVFAVLFSQLFIAKRQLRQLLTKLQRDHAKTSSS